ncbi:MAG: L-lysine 6-transaminase [Bacteroidota bacterium]|nr:L-lysine 6-transaminase [Bacteroidota bacterium]
MMRNAMQIHTSHIPCNPLDSTVLGRGEHPSGKTARRITPELVLPTLKRYMLVDGFDIVLDLQRSSGSRLIDAVTGRAYLDLFTFFASSPVGINHPSMLTESFREEIFHAAVNKPSNSDIYTVEMAQFVETFARLCIPPYFSYAFFIEGGAPAVENALKAAFDWKVQKNARKNLPGERGHKIVHFRRAFHGRTGYTLSLTNTDETKIRFFPKFQDWPRIDAPAAIFPLEGENLERTMMRESVALDQMKQAFAEHGDDIAAVIIEPIQGEGGDNHFRPEFLKKLRELADENDALLIFDEVQTGIGITGRMWAHEWFVKPDILVFGKKTQVCGILAGPRIDEIESNVFHVSSRINSTWGGNLTDMVRSRKYLEIIEEEKLVENAERTGAYLLARLQEMAAEFPGILSNPRGRGLFCAVDFPSQDFRDAVRRKAYEDGLIILGCGERSLRFRPALNVTKEILDEGLDIIRGAVLTIERS